METCLHLIAETAIHMNVNGKVQKLAIPFKPRVDLNALAIQYNIEVQGFAIQPCSTTTPPDAYQPVEDLTPSIGPTETLWIKAKKRNGETCVCCKRPGAGFLSDSCLMLLFACAQSGLQHNVMLMHALHAFCVGGNWFVNLFLGPPQPQPYVRAC